MGGSTVAQTIWTGYSGVAQIGNVNCARIDDSRRRGGDAGVLC